MQSTDQRRSAQLARLALCAALSTLIMACVIKRPGDVARHRWYAGLGPVLPHDTFPADCTVCHEGSKWHTLKEDFQFDHEEETGVALYGAHKQAKCLRCHNDRGPVDIFAAKGCAGCHEQVHTGDLGDDCSSCHVQTTWQPVGQIERHNRTRFPLVGVHAVTACHRCHIGGEVGSFSPTDTECVTCHQDDLLQTTNHIGLGWVDRCDRCHMPTAWQQAEVD